MYLDGVGQVEPQAVRPGTNFYDPYVNDFPSVDPRNEPDVTPEWSLSLRDHIEGADRVVPTGDYFAMGDNRTNSVDSRFSGFIPRENIIGRPLFVYWSIVMPEAGPEEKPLSEQDGSTMHELVHFLDETRWSRTFHPIR